MALISAGVVYAFSTANELTDIATKVNTDKATAKQALLDRVASVEKPILMEAFMERAEEKMLERASAGSFNTTIDFDVRLYDSGNWPWDNIVSLDEAKILGEYKRKYSWNGGYGYFYSFNDTEKQEIVTYFTKKGFEVSGKERELTNRWEVYHELKDAIYKKWWGGSFEISWKPKK